MRNASRRRLVGEGVSVSLAHNPLTEKAPDNDSPFRHTMLSTGQHPSGQFVLDQYAVSYHGLAHTHMDTLCHMAWNGKMYNGFPQADVTDGGAKELARLQAATTKRKLGQPKCDGGGEIHSAIALYCASRQIDLRWALE